MKISEIRLKNHMDEDIYGELVAPDTSDKNIPAILLVPGIGLDRDNYGLLSKIAEMLAIDGMASYRFDFSGCGKSDGEFVNSTMTKMATELNLIIDYIRNHSPYKDNKTGAYGQCSGGEVIMASKRNVDSICLNAATTEIYSAIADYLNDSFNPSGISIKIRSDKKN